VFEHLPTIHELRTACRHAFDVTDADFAASRKQRAAGSRALYCWLLADIFELDAAEVAEACQIDTSTVYRMLADMREHVRNKDAYTLDLIDRAERFAAALVHTRLGPVPWRKETDAVPESQTQA
jgi:hypothetical protein